MNNTKLINTLESKIIELAEADKLQVQDIFQAYSLAKQPNLNCTQQICDSPSSDPVCSKVEIEVVPKTETATVEAVEIEEKPVVKRKRAPRKTAKQKAEEAEALKQEQEKEVEPKEDPEEQESEVKTETEPEVKIKKKKSKKDKNAKNRADVYKEVRDEYDDLLQKRGGTSKDFTDLVEELGHDSVAAIEEVDDMIALLEGTKKLGK